MILMTKLSLGKKEKKTDLDFRLFRLFRVAVKLMWLSIMCFSALLLITVLTVRSY